MKFPWTKPRSASLDDLRGQLEHARGALVDAKRAVAAGQIAFDDAGSSDAEKTLIVAREAERSATEHVARAERLLAAAEQRRAEAEQLEKAEQVRKLQAKLADKTLVAELVQAEFKAWCGVVDARLARMDQEDERAKMRQGLMRLGVASNPGAEQVGIYEVAALLDKIADGVRKTDMRRYEVLRHFAVTLFPNLDRYTHVYVPPPREPQSSPLPPQLASMEELSSIAQTTFGGEGAREVARRRMSAAAEKQTVEYAIAPGFYLAVSRRGEVVGLKEGDEVTLADLASLPLEVTPQRFMDQLVKCWRVLQKGEPLR